MDGVSYTFVELHPGVVSFIYFGIIVAAIYLAIYSCNKQCEQKKLFAHIIVAMLCPVCYVIYALVVCGGVMNK